MKDYEVVKVEKPEDRLDDVNRRLKRNLIFSIVGLATACTLFATAPVGSFAYAAALGMTTGSIGSIIRKLKEKSQIKKEIKNNNQKVM